MARIFEEEENLIDSFVKTKQETILGADLRYVSSTGRTCVALSNPILGCSSRRRTCLKPIDVYHLIVETVQQAQYANLLFLRGGRP